MSQNQGITIDKKHYSLQADCENCFGLCCVALPFAASADFAIDKEGGKPCSNLQEDFRCSIHKNLRQKGFQGCTVFDCFGAGQKVSQVTFNGKDWREAPESAKQMYDAFSIMRQLHEMLWYLNEALSLKPANTIHKEIKLALEETERLTYLSPEFILEIDLIAHRSNINELLLKTSELVRSDFGRQEKKSLGKQKTYSRGTDLIGAKLKGADLSGANLRGAYMIATDLRNADMRVADLIGADFRDADIRGANLTGSIFLTQAQINAAKGDAATKLPPLLIRPAHW